MTNANCCMLMSSCDAYSDLWNPFFYYLKKNWPEFNLKVYIITESKDFSYDGFDITMLHCNTKLWSKRHMYALNSIKEQFVLYMLDDFWLSEKVDDMNIVKLFNYIYNDPKMGYLSFIRHCTSRSRPVIVAHSKSCIYQGLRESTKGMPYRINTQAGFWRKSFFLKTFKEHENAWQYELRANTRCWLWPEKVYSVHGDKDAIKYPDGGVIWRGVYRSKEIMNSFDTTLFSDSIAKRGYYEPGKVKPSNPSKKDISWLIGLIKSYMPNF